LNPDCAALAREARAVGIHLIAFSRWPAAWHPIVIRILHEARRLGVQDLYLKEKLGGLRIQGGGAALLPAVIAAERETSRICAACGDRCESPLPPELPMCETCGSAKSIGEIRWVEADIVDNAANRGEAGNAAAVRE
jgi:hypothetical protein